MLGRRVVIIAAFSGFAVFSDFDDFHGIGAAGLAEGLADGQHDIVAPVYGTAFEQFILRHMQRQS